MPVVQLKRSAVPGKVPLTTDINLGELAVNTFDGRIFFKKDPGTQSIVEVTTLDGAQTITGNKTFTGGAYFIEVVSRALSNTEGGQFVLGYANNTTTTGQGNSTWNIDVNDFTNQNLRFFRVNSSGAADVALSIPETGSITVNRSLTLGTNGISANGTFGTGGQILTSNGSAVYWSTVSGVSNNLDGLTDVVITAPSNGQVLKYNGTNWINDTDATGGGGGNLDALTDVVITTPSTGQVLKYNGTNWVNDTDATGGGGGITTGKAIAMAIVFG